MLKRILVIDDEAAWRSMISAALRGYDVMEADSVEKASQQIEYCLLHKVAVSAVILDLQLSKEAGGLGSGMVVLRLLRERYPSLPIIIYSGYRISLELADKLFRTYKVFGGIDKDRADQSNVLRDMVDSATRQYSAERSKRAKVLYLSSDPIDQTQLDLDDEHHRISQIIRQAQASDLLDFEAKMDVRVEELQAVLVKYQPQIVHFAGHSRATGELVLVDSKNLAAAVPAAAIEDLFAVLQNDIDIKCVVLNACYTDNLANALARSVDCVIGMNDAITDQAALKFSAAFYQSLAYGSSVKQAYLLGCNQLRLDGLAEASIPKLFSIRCNPNDVVFVKRLDS